MSVMKIRLFALPNEMPTYILILYTGREIAYASQAKPFLFLFFSFCLSHLMGEHLLRDLYIRSME